MNALLSLVLTWMWGVMSPLLAVEAHGGTSASPQPPPTCAPASSGDGGQAACAATGTGPAHAAPRKSDTIYNGI